MNVIDVEAPADDCSRDAGAPLLIKVLSADVEGPGMDG